MGVRKRIYVDCLNAEPCASAFSSDLSAVDGADTTTTRFTAGGYEMEFYNEAANALLIPKRTLDANSCDGWALPIDNVNVNGGELTFGILADEAAQHCFKIGTDSAFELKVQLGIPAVADYNVCAVGFRTATAYDAAITTAATLYDSDYSDQFGVNIDAGDYKVFQSIAGTDLQDDVAVTDAVNDDAPVITVRMSSSGVGSVLVDGTAVTLTNTGQAGLTAAAFVVPFIRIVNNATTTGAGDPQLRYIKCGYQ